MVQLLSAAAALASVASAAKLTAVPNFGSNPSGIGMNIYVPDTLPASPSVILAIHPCMGSASGWFSMSQLQSHADKKGLILIYPETKKDLRCWDSNSKASLVRGGGGDSTGLANTVKWTTAKYNVPVERTYAIGYSSGAMMVNTLAGTYPDLFRSMAAFSGVPAGCLKDGRGSSPMSSDQRCATGKIVRTPAEYKAIIESMYPGYTGKRPNLSIWHGDADSIVNYQVFGEELKLWSTVLGVEFKGNVTDNPARGYEKSVYGDGTKLVAYTSHGGSHFWNFGVTMPAVLAFFGL